MSDDYSLAGMARHTDALLDEVRADLRRVSEDTTQLSAGRGIAVQGRVRATVGHRGYLTDLAIDHRWVAEVDNAALVKAVKEAVCNAVDDVHRQLERLALPTAEMGDLVEAFDTSLDGISTDLARAISRGVPT